MRAKVLVLDAMGVIYRSGDDVVELLIPFIRTHGRRSASDEEISDAYRQASFGRLSSCDFWIGLGCDPLDEDEYLAQHGLQTGLLQFLARARDEFEQIWCLSNDVSEWSAKLRSRHQLEPWFRGWLISGDVGLRKPSPLIYSLLSERVGVAGAELLFVDDRRPNLEAAAALGWGTVHFDLQGRRDEASCAEAWASILRRQ